MPLFVCSSFTPLFITEESLTLVRVMRIMVNAPEVSASDPQTWNMALQ